MSLNPGLKLPKLMASMASTFLQLTWPLLQLQACFRDTAISITKVISTGLVGLGRVEFFVLERYQGLAAS